MILETTRAADETSGAGPQAPWCLPAGASLGPAHVLEPDSEGAALRVLLGDGRCVEAEWALPYRYQAEPGDVLLVISRGEGHYVLSVLSGRGRNLLALQGDGVVGAEGGKLRLRGDRGVRLVGPRVTLRAQVFQVAVRVVHEKLGQVTRRIAGRLFERSGSSRRVIEGDDWHSAGERTLVAADSVLFDGNLIRVS